MPSNDEHRRVLVDAVDRDDLPAAVGAAALLCGDPDGVSEDDVQALRRLTALAGVLPPPESGTGATRLELARGLMRLGLHPVAVAVLEPLLEEEPARVDVLEAMLWSLHESARHDQALAVGLASPAAVPGTFAVHYLLALSAVMVGALDIGQAQLQLLPEPSDAHQLSLTRRVTDMVRRALLVLDLTSSGPLRAWHFAWTGGVLLRVQDPSVPDMSGRYAYQSESLQQCRTTLAVLRQALEWMQSPVDRVLYAPDISSEVIGRALALMSGVEALPWPTDGTGERGLLVCHDLETVPPMFVEQVVAHRPGQVLYVHTSDWTTPQAVAGDLTGYLAQWSATPWTEAEARADLVAWALRLQPVEPLPVSDDVLQLKALISAAASLPADGGLAARREDGPRARQVFGSAVLSAHFGS